VDDLVVDDELTAVVVDDEDADGSTAVVKALRDTVEEVALVEDGQTSLDLTGLGHGSDGSVVVEVKNTVLLEDGTVHVLDNHGGGRVGDERRLLMKLLGEQVNTEITVLTSLRGSGDPNNLAGTTLKDQEVTNPNVVAWDGDGRVGRRGRGSHLVTGNRGEDLGVGQRSHRRTRSGRDNRTVGGSRGRSSSGNKVLLLEDDAITLLGVVLAVVVLKGMSDTVSSALKSSTEGVVVALVVVIAHALLLGERRGRESY